MASNQDERSGAGKSLMAGNRGRHVMGRQCWWRGRCDLAMQHASGIAAVACGREAAQEHPAVTPTLAELFCPRAPAHLRGLAQSRASALRSVHPGTLAGSPCPRQETESHGFKKQRQEQEKEGEEQGHSSTFQSGCMKNLPVKARVPTPRQPNPRPYKDTLRLIGSS